MWVVFYVILDAMDFTRRYQSLNVAQKEAVDTIDGPVMVVAGPGTGKTELLSMRTANILRKTDTLPENILCLTFTDSGAAAMRERLQTIIGRDAYKVAIHTFHSFGSEVINQNGAFFYHGAHFRAADELSSYEIIRSIFDTLPYDSPLASKMNDEYTYLPDTLQVISELKRSGLISDELLRILDDNTDAMDSIEPGLAEIFAIGIKKNTAQILHAFLEQQEVPSSQPDLAGIVPLKYVLVDSLKHAVTDAEMQSSTKPITAWRNTWMQKDQVGAFVFKSRERCTKLRAVSYVYFQYLTKMQEAELYDFDDMILRVVHAIEVFPDLKANLQEKYQYIMVDEFQDTNLAQMRILSNLTDNPANSGRPNIMIVGDDDQAIYSFQGAEISNILQFRDQFENVRLITLIDNYRSTAAILESARRVITLGSERLEKTIPELDKTLTPHYNVGGDTPKLVEAASTGEERARVARDIQMLLDQGVAPKSIAVLARRHYELVALLPYLAEQKIAVNYEHRDDVLELDIITVIELVSTILIALFESRHDDANALLPRLLAHPAWDFSAEEIWQLSLEAKATHKSWMQIMAVTKRFIPFYTWLIENAKNVSHTPLEYMLDLIIGHESRISEIQTVTDQPKSEETFHSPLFRYYFSAEKLTHEPDTYVRYLEALRTIRTKLKEYQPTEVPKLQTFIEFIRLHRSLGSSITSIRSASHTQDTAIHLMTAHKSKGLEFAHVFVIGAVDTSWGERVRTRSRLIGYPENLPLAPSGSSFDERLRLFYVAMTRAKDQLTLSYATSADNGKVLERASFLLDDWQPETSNQSTTLANLEATAELDWYAPIMTVPQPKIRELLKPELEKYKLSVTHLTNFLNIPRGGPQYFLMQNLLRFPQAPSPSAAYGSAIHRTLQRAHSHLSAIGSLRPTEDVFHDFEEILAEQHLDTDSYSTYLQKGTASLEAFLKAKYASFQPSQKVELNFGSQHSMVGDACLTGSLDLVDFHPVNRTIIVTDYKTGHPARSWSGRTPYEKLKLHRYKQQLMFYTLLIENSRDYGSYNVERGVLQFVEPTRTGEILALDAVCSRDELERFSLLIQAVWSRIMTFDFPDISPYSDDLSGVKKFEDDLIDTFLKQSK